MRMNTYPTIDNNHKAVTLDYNKSDFVKLSKLHPNTIALVDFYTHQDDRLVIMPTAYVLINCDLNSETKIIEELKDLPELVEISKVVGSYDMVAKVTARHGRKVQGSY